MPGGGRTERGRAKKLAVAWLFSRAGGWQRAEYHCGYCKSKKLYEGRNCKLYFPDLVEINRKPIWVARFPIPGDKEKRQASVGAYKTNECPTSLITAQSLWLLEQVRNNESLHETGATAYGPDANKYPAWWIDAIEAVNNARFALEDAIDRARNAGN